jgi:hypothetical protein
MRSGWLALLAVLAPPLLSTTTAAEPDTDPVARLIDRLGSARYSEREAACRTLEACGLAALAPCREACANPDPEIQRRAEELTARLENRLESSRLLLPSRVRLTYHNLPLTNALDDLRRKTGLAIDILDNHRARLAGRKVTLDTGEVTLWEALDQFCRAAGVVEAMPTVAQPAPTDVYLSKGRFIVVDDGRLPTQPKQDVRLLLADGKPGDLPTCCSGAVRLQLLPPDTQLPGQIKAEGETILALEVTPEPGLYWQQVVGLEVQSAVDARGQKLIQPVVYVGNGDPLAQAYNEIALWTANGSNPYAPAASQRRLPVRLKLPADPCATLRDLRGRVALKVQTPPETLLSVAAVFGTNPRSFPTRDGGTLTLAEAALEDSLLRLRVSVSSPPADVDVNALGARIIRINRGVRAGTPLAGEGPTEIKLLNDKDQPLRFVKGDCQYESDGNVSTRHYTLCYQPAGKAASLVLTGRRTVVVEVPFAFHDVPLGR